MDGVIPNFSVRHPLQVAVDQIVAKFPTQLDAAKHYANKKCSACRGSGFLMVLQRAGATDQEPRTARVCGCAKKRIMKAAEEKKHATVRREGSQE